MTPTSGSGGGRSAIVNVTIVPSVGRAGKPPPRDRQAGAAGADGWTRQVSWAESDGVQSWNAGADEAHVLEHVFAGRQHADHVIDRHRVVRLAPAAGPRLTGEAPIASRLALIRCSEAATLHHANGHAADRGDRFGAIDSPCCSSSLGVGATKNDCGKTGDAGKREAGEADGPTRSCVIQRLVSETRGVSRFFAGISGHQRSGESFTH